MKRILMTMLCAVFAVSLATAQKVEKKDKKETTKFTVENMHCGGCVKKIEKNIGFEKGVTDIKCDLDNHTVEVTYRTDKTSKEKIAKAFEKINMEAIAIEGERAK